MKFPITLFGMSTAATEHAPKEKRTTEAIALKKFAQHAVALYKEEDTWNYLINQGLPSIQMLLADFDVDAKWEQAIGRLPQRFVQRARDIHAAIAAARPLKRALVDESLLTALSSDMGEPPIRIAPYQQVEIAAWENLRLRGANSTHLLTDILLYTHPQFARATVSFHEKEIEHAGRELGTAVAQAAQVSLTQSIFPAEKVIEGLLTSSIPLRPPSRRRTSSVTASHR